MLSIAERHKYILDSLNKHGFVRITDVANELGVTKVTIRKDIKILESKGLLYKVHGSARPANPHVADLDVHVKDNINRDAKRRIAQRAAEMLGETDSIIMASGSTVYAFAEEIKMRMWHHLNIVTPFLRLGVLLNEAENVNVVQLGGTVHKKSLSVLGEEAARSLDDCICSKLFFGVDGIDTLPQLIAQKLQKHKRVLMEPAQRPVIVENIPIRRESEFRAWLPIMYGCDNFCTYCIVPYVRGREKSRKPGDILAEFRSLVEAGYKEITLLGQNVNSYGKGLEEQIDFSDLLNLLCTVPGDYHIRFMTSHPKDASHKLIDTIAAQPKLCKHLHLPVQCGSDRLLQQMNRHYTVEQYLELIDYARKTVPGITFSSDIIVGFPGETEEDFQGTLELVKKVGYMQLFTFIYSKRTGTKAAEMPDPTPRAEKTDRMTRLLKVQDEIAMDLVRQQVGQTVRVLVEGYGRSDGTLSGRLDNNLTVEFAADPALMGSYAQVHLTGARATVLLGELET